MSFFPIFTKKTKKQSTATITFGDVAENHVGMEKIGKLHKSGYSFEIIERVRKHLEEKGLTCELILLHPYWEGTDHAEEAYVLVIRKGAQHILKEDSMVNLIAENEILKVDKHALMGGRVVNKLARWNLCFAD
jgi:hypothetical protein